MAFLGKAFEVFFRCLHYCHHLYKFTSLQIPLFFSPSKISYCLTTLGSKGLAFLHTKRNLVFILKKKREEERNQIENSRDISNTTTLCTFFLENLLNLYFVCINYFKNILSAQFRLFFYEYVM